MSRLPDGTVPIPIGMGCSEWNTPRRSESLRFTGGFGIRQSARGSPEQYFAGLLCRTRRRRLRPAMRDPRL